MAPWQVGPPTPLAPGVGRAWPAPRWKDRSLLRSGRPPSGERPSSAPPAFTPSRSRKPLREGYLRRFPGLPADRPWTVVTSPSRTRGASPGLTPAKPGRRGACRSATQGRPWQKASRSPPPVQYRKSPRYGLPRRANGRPRPPRRRPPNPRLFPPPTVPCPRVLYLQGRRRPEAHRCCLRPNAGRWAPSGERRSSKPS